LVKVSSLGKKEFTYVPIIASFLLAISPWHLQFSRIAFESNVAMLIDMLIALFFIKGLKRPSLLIISAFFAGLNLYTYQAEKVFTPLLVIGLLLIWRKDLFKKANRNSIIISGIVGLLLTLPFLYMAKTTPEIFLRAKGTSLAADQTNFLAHTVERLNRDIIKGDKLGLIFDNRRVTYLLAYIGNYFSHFDFNWLFLSGDEARHHAPGMGLLYLYELPFLLWGLYTLAASNLDNKSKKLIFFWLLLAPFPASFSSGAPHAVRSLRMMPMIQVITAFGAVAFLQWLFLQKKVVRLFFLLSVTLFALFNFGYYINQYFNQQDYFYADSWQYGYQQAVGEVKQVESRYDKIIVSNQPYLDQSYMFFLFYLKYDPALYLEHGGTVSGGFNENHMDFGKYIFRPIDWKAEERNNKVLFVGRPQDFPDGVKVIKTIFYPNGKEAIKIVEG